MKIPHEDITFVLPAKDEEASVGSVVSGLITELPGAEILVVDDGSSDRTASVAAAAGATVISHPYSKGNGAAIKTGIRCAKREYAVCMDADGQHRPTDAKRLIDRLGQGFDLVIGARTRFSDQSTSARWAANRVYNLMASWMVGHRVDDLTSGFRAGRVSTFKQFLQIFPNGFSYPTTSTIAFFRAGYSVDFIPIKTDTRAYSGKSHIRTVKDGAKFFLIIFRIGTLYSPLKIFVPAAAFLFMCGAMYFFYTKLAFGRFTNFGGLLFLTSMLTFLIGLVSEQITNLLYLNSDRQNENKDTSSRKN